MREEIFPKQPHLTSIKKKKAAYVSAGSSQHVQRPPPDASLRPKVNTSSNQGATKGINRSAIAAGEARKDGRRATPNVSNRHHQMDAAQPRN